VRAAVGVAEDAVLFLYLGRLSRDKGVFDLALAFARLAQRHAAVCLVLVGPDEERLAKQIEETVVPCADRVRIIDHTDRPEDYMAAAWLARVPLRIHTFTGQVWATRKGPTRTLLRAIDGLIARCATHVLVDSRSQREFLIANRVVAASKSAVLAEGSICGVDGERFRPDGAARSRVRAAVGVADDAVLFLYLGRLSKDKGVFDLAFAFARLAQRHAAICLVLVGPDEERLGKQIKETVVACADRVRIIDHTDRPEDYMAAADVFCLPSHREGFGQVAIEAAAAGLPVIASRIYGIVDAVVDRETGLLHPPADVEVLRSHMETLLVQPDLRRKLGGAGRSRALRDFSTRRVTQALLEFYAGITAKL